MVTRTHIVLPEDLIEQVDKIAGKRKRSRFIEEAIRQMLSREALRKALDEARGVLSAEDYPEWSTPERTSAWVHRSRQEDDAHRRRKLKGWQP